MSEPTTDPRGERLCGWEAIAAYLASVMGVEVRPMTAVRYSRLAVDPLPARCNLRMRAAAVTAWSTYLREWVLRQRGDTTLPRLEGWGAICKALGGVGRDMAWQWAHRSRDPLPVNGLGKAGKRVGTPWIYESALRDWVHGGDVPHQVAHPERQGWIPRNSLAVKVKQTHVDIEPKKWLLESVRVRAKPTFCDRR